MRSWTAFSGPRSCTTCTRPTPTMSWSGTKPDEVVPYKILPEGVDSVKEVAGSRLKLFSEGGKSVLRG